MRIVKDVLAELIGMFLSDARLTLCILAVVALSAGWNQLSGADPLFGGLALLLGCLGVFFAVVLLAARRR